MKVDGRQRGRQVRTVRTGEERHLQEKKKKKKIMVFRTKLDEKILVQKKLKSKLIMMKVGSGGGDGDEGDEKVMKKW